MPTAHHGVLRGPPGRPLLHEAERVHQIHQDLCVVLVVVVVVAAAAVVAAGAAAVVAAAAAPAVVVAVRPWVPGVRINVSNKRA